MTDYQLDKLSIGKEKRRRTCHTHLHDICSFYSTYPSEIEYVFAAAKCKVLLPNYFSLTNQPFLISLGLFANETEGIGARCLVVRYPRKRLL